VTETSASVREWRRLSPWALFHFFGVGAKFAVNNAAVLAPLAVAAYTQSLVWFLAVGVVAVVIAHSVISYRCFSYSIASDRIQVKQGLFKRTDLDLVFERIQNIDIILPFYFRPFNLVSLKIDGAGSANSEVVLAALETQDALAIRDSVLGRRNALNTVSPKSESLADSLSDSSSAGNANTREDQLICTRAIGDLVRHGMSSNKALIFLVGLAAIFGQSLELFLSYLPEIGFDRSMIPGSGGVQVAIFVVGSLMSVVGVFLLISVLGAIFIYFDYQLYATSDGFKARYGLLTRNERTVKTRRIQTVVWQQNWIDRVLGRFNLVFEQISHLPQASQLNADSRLVVPSLEPDTAQPLSCRALGKQDQDVFNPQHLEYLGINWRHWRKNSLIALLIIVVMVVSFGGSAGKITPLMPGALVVWCFALALLYRRYRCWGIAEHNGVLVVRSGLIGLSYTQLDVSKLQQVQRVSTLFTRRADLSHLRLKIASQSMTVPYLPDSETVRLINGSLYVLESNEVSWM